MANSDEIFLALEQPFEEAAQQVAEVLGLEFNGDWRAETGELQYKVRARTFDGNIGVYIGPNDYQPEPGEVQAMDGRPRHRHLAPVGRRLIRAGHRRLGWFGGGGKTSAGKGSLEGIPACSAGCMGLCSGSGSCGRCPAPAAATLYLALPGIRVSEFGV